MKLTVTPNTTSMYIVNPMGQFSSSELTSLMATASDSTGFSRAFELREFDHGILKVEFCPNEFGAEVWDELASTVEGFGYLTTKTFQEYIKALANS